MTTNTKAPYNVDDFAPEAKIKRAGTIKITDVETGESEIHATYAAEDVLRLLALGIAPQNLVHYLEGGE
jgi:hypothetical protein